MPNETEAQQDSREMQQMAAREARMKARTGRWDLDVAIFLFAVLIIIMILLFQGISIEIVAPVALFGLIMVWLVGWRREKQLYRIYYKEELAKLKHEREKKTEETIEEEVQRRLRERWR